MTNVTHKLFSMYLFLFITLYKFRAHRAHHQEFSGRYNQMHPSTLFAKELLICSFKKISFQATAQSQS